MKLKGSAIIELTNADGTKETHKHDNMITNAVADFFKSYRGEMPPVFKIMSNDESYATALFGGILLFDDTLNADADDYVIPSTKITGYASQDAYGGLDVARGSYNLSESGVQEDGSYKFVWDFSTAQANGKIQSLGLCPNLMGKIGASDTIQSESSINTSFLGEKFKPFNTNGYMLDSNGYTDNMSNYRFCIVAIIDDIAYAIDLYNVSYNSNFASVLIKNNGGVLKLHKFKVCTKNISLYDKACMARYLGCVDVTLPSSFISSLYTSTSGVYIVTTEFCHETGKLIVYPLYFGSNLSVNGTLSYLEIDLKNNMSITSHTFTNNTGGAIQLNNSDCNKNYSSIKGYSLYICKDYVVTVSIVNNEKRMYVVKRDDNTSVKEVKYSNGNVFSVEKANDKCICPLFISGKILVFRFCHSASYANYRIYILDLETGILKETNSTAYQQMNTVELGSKVYYPCAGTYLNFASAINPFVLTTKNNLDSPVTKTASQTMKITYTLSESE